VSSSPSQRYAPWLWLLAGIFVVRVLAQPVALWIESSMLPPFEAWHSDVLPYPVLVATQLLLAAWLGRTAWTFTTGAVLPRPRLGVAMLVAGWIYLAAMVTRLLLGATVLSHVRWFASSLPTVFHIVLAAYLLLFGHFHMRYGCDRRRGLEGSA
jgi:hypothetical protein